MKSTRTPTSRRRRPAIMAAMSRSSARTWKSAPSSSAAPRHPSRAFTMPQLGKYELLRMIARVDDKKMPFIRVMDLRMESKKQGLHPLGTPHHCHPRPARQKKSRPSCFSIAAASPLPLICPACGHVCQCPELLRGPHLSSRRRPPRLPHLRPTRNWRLRKCPACQDPGIRYSGTGTEKVEGRGGKNSSQRRSSGAWTPTSCSGATPTAKTLHAFRVGEDRYPRRHPDDRQGAAFFPMSPSSASSNADLGLHMPDFPRRRTHLPASHPSRRPAPGRGDVEGEVFVQELHPFQPLHPVRAAPRFRRLLGTGNRVPPPMGLPALHTTWSSSSSAPRTRARASFSAETLHRRLKEVLPASVTLSEPGPRPAGEIPRQLPFPPHAPHPPHPQAQPRHPRRPWKSSASPRTSSSPSTWTLFQLL